MTFGILVALITRRFLNSEVDGSNQQLYHFAMCLSKTLYPHCYSRLSWLMSTRGEHPREGCLFSAMSLTEEIALKYQRIL